LLLPALQKAPGRASDKVCPQTTNSDYCSI
jgi:hypothetical protein